MILQLTMCPHLLLCKSLGKFPLGCIVRTSASPSYLHYSKTDAWLSDLHSDDVFALHLCGGITWWWFRMHEHTHTEGEIRVQEMQTLREKMIVILSQTL